MEIRIYNEALGLDATILELVDWAYRYDGDYSDEALDEIARQAESLGLPKEKYRIPTLVKLARQRSGDTLPYEHMKLDKLIYGRIGFEESTDYGEVEVREEGDKVLVAITGTDDEGPFTAANAVPMDEFMDGEGNYLEELVGNALFYGKTYEQ